MKFLVKIKNVSLKTKGTFWLTQHIQRFWELGHGHLLGVGGGHHSASHINDTRELGVMTGAESAGGTERWDPGHKARCWSWIRRDR